MQPLSENAVNVPAFLSKLWKMVNDSSTNHLICWSASGNSFIIQNQAQFWYELLPLYYKHNNMSSFVRQLNMYGFHKMTTVENGTMDIDKDEIQFYHPNFQKDQPEMLKEIKRKVTGTKTMVPEADTQSSIKTDVTKVLADVKQLRSHQQTVDSQLSSIKQENAVLWRELAMLRQKHMKQQQIVNKLIQFLVTIVQPSNRMSGLGVKRRYPLMIHGTPHKKSKTKSSRSTSVGPTIHELDSEVLTDDLFEVSDDTQQQVQSPATPNETSQKTPPPDNLFDDVNISSVGSVSPDVFLNSPELEYSEHHVDKPEFISIDEFLDDPTPQTNEDVTVIDSLQKAVAEEIEDSNISSNKVFLNPSAQDTLLCNLISGNFNTNSLKQQEKDNISGKSLKENYNSVTSVNPTSEATTANSEDNNMAIATRDSLTAYDYKRLTIEELDEHLKNTQSDLDQLKDVLNGCGTFDANALLGVPFPRKLFNDSPSYSLSCGKKENPEGTELAEVCNELTTYNSDIIDFNELFDDAELQDQVTQDEWPLNISKDVVLNNVKSEKTKSSQ